MERKITLEKKKPVEESAQDQVNPQINAAIQIL